MRIAVVVAMLGSGGCYTPSIEPCRYACNGQSCPAGLVCSNEGMCAESVTQVCGANTDGGQDAEIDAMIDSACGWSTSNVDACPLRAHMVTTDWTLPIATTIDTGSLTIMPQLGSVSPPVLTQLPQGGEAALLMVQNLNVEFELTVRGPRPLIILVNGQARIIQAIRVEPPPIGTPALPGCNAMPGTMGGSGGSGGGGGGGFGPSSELPPVFGATGGPYNGNPVLPGGVGGGSAGTVSLVPLRGGCSGGAGGFTTGAGAGSPGLGGGAIQISARTALTFTSGSIDARGIGGGSAPTRNGAGGGGSGGAILLEAPTISLDGASKLCACGGGGGAGGPSNTVPPSGSDGTCTGIGAAGAMTANGTNGGNGSGRLGNPGIGGASASGGLGGGGGGGGAGRIRINGALTTAGTSLIVPIASMSP